MPSRASQIALAVKAKRHGARRYALRTVIECQAAAIPVSLGMALLQQETNFQNIFGHDPTIFVGAGTVTKKKYLQYKAERKRTGKMQGVGPTQLTWWEFQDRADKLGGCWKPAHNIRVGVELLASYYHEYKSKGHTTRDAIRLAGVRFNGADSYGRQLLAHYDAWHEVLR